jgi:hypothetical protein
MRGLDAGTAMTLGVAGADADSAPPAPLAMVPLAEADGSVGPPDPCTTEVDALGVAAVGGDIPRP